MSFLVPGLVSITFRQLSPLELIELVAKSGLKAMEWGGDVHVPHGNLVRAREVGVQTREAGLSVAAYGSYYRLGASEEAGLPFEQVLASAVALGAPTIRLWAGLKGSSETSDTERAAVVADTLRVAELAQAQGVTVSLEYHANTLTDTRESVSRLLGEVQHPALKYLWQPANGELMEENVARFHDLLPHVQHVHVFHWWPTAAVRHALVEGETPWKTYLEIAKSAGRPMPCLLEFVLGDRPEQFIEDAATLKRWLAELEEN